MTDSDQRAPGHAPWAPLPVEAAQRPGSHSLIADGAVIRSRAAQPAPIGDSGTAEWPWDRPENQSRATPARPVATDDLYRPSTPDQRPEMPSTAPDTSVGPVQAPPADPFRLTPASTDAAMDNAGMKTWGVVLTDVMATTLAATIDMYVNLRPTWITGAVFMLACVVTAIQVRRSDLSIAVITPPLAFVFAIAVAAGASSAGESGSILLRMGRDIFTALAFNAPFVFGGTGLALVIVAIRIIRAPRA